MHQIDVEQARECLSELIQQTVTGQDVVITSDHRPLVRLVQIDEPTRIRAGSVNLFTMSEDLAETLSPLVPARPMSLDEIAATQNIRPVKSIDDVLGGWPEDDLDDGFEDAVRCWRDEGLELAG